MNVIVCTTSSIKDQGVQAVTSALNERGADVIRFETDRFPTESLVTIGWDRDERDDRDDRADRLLLASDATSAPVDLATVGAVWMRHTDTGDRLPEDMDPSHRQAARMESDALVWGLLECLDGVYQLDPVSSVRAAPYKPRQLQLARRHGLEIPRSLITNDPAAVRAFAHTLDAGMIAKLVDGSTLVADPAAPTYTRRMDKDDLADLEALAYAPMIFQELVPKARELRITVVGHNVFVAAVDSQKSAAGEVDWRRDKGLHGDFRPYHELPPAIVERVLALLTRLDLDFATIDMIVTPDGRHVFLELNTVSYFDFIERATGLPIAAAIADLLTGRAPSRMPHRTRRT